MNLIINLSHKINNMKKRVILIFSLILFTGIFLNAQENKKYKGVCIGFYNLENLFDTFDDTLKNDEQFLPNGSYSWTQERFQEKLNNMAEVIAKIGTDINPEGVSILGVSEIENRFVLEELVKTDALKDRNYKIVHFDSPDFRGVDNGLIYQEKYFKVIAAKAYKLSIPEIEDFATRDQILVSGLVENDTVHIIVNHWPSRRGGEKRSRPRRIEAAKISRHISDSIFSVQPNAKIIIMGDLNDNPTDVSIKKYLKAKGKKDELKDNELYNPYESLFKKGFGSNAYRDVWSLFDQIIVSSSLVGNDYSKLTMIRPSIFKRNFLLQQNGKYKGYPNRTYGAGVYMGGYSDHFPVYLFLIKEIN